jgi:predicted enzyme related to lactoylglutathione lyase
MNVADFNINLTSDQPDQMIAFYRNVVGLAPAPEMGDGALKAGPVHLFIDGHSETRGPAREPSRVLVNFWVDDLPAEESRLETAGVKFTRKQGKESWGGTISTFLDPDGNFCQLVHFNPEDAQPDAQS